MKQILSKYRIDFRLYICKKRVDLDWIFLGFILVFCCIYLVLQFSMVEYLIRELRSFGLNFGLFIVFFYIMQNFLFFLIYFFVRVCYFFKVNILLCIFLGMLEDGYDDFNTSEDLYDVIGGIL